MTAGTIQSMTGYGRAMRRARQAAVTVEVRSTNHRYLEVDQRLPGNLSGVQGRVAELIRARIQRGRVHDDRRRVVLDDALLRRYHDVLRAVQRRFKLGGPVTLEHLLALPQAVNVIEDRPASDVVWAPLRAAVVAAAAALEQNRRREGARLVADLRRQLDLIARHVRAVTTRLPHALKAQQEHVRGRLQELLGPQAAGSASQLEEAVALVQAADVHEELVRLRSHLTHMRQTLAGGGLVGKALDFIAQELTREANTLGAKVNDGEAARHVVAVKGCIERIREQVQNLQ
jgi:uncharacterized protein (TIGR00255 family)